MKAHEENLSEKEKSTEEKAKETGKILIQNAHIHQVHVFPAETKLLIFMNTFWLNKNILFRYFSTIRKGQKTFCYSVYFKHLLDLVENPRWNYSLKQLQ